MISLHDQRNSCRCRHGRVEVPPSSVTSLQLMLDTYLLLAFGADNTLEVATLARVEIRGPRRYNLLPQAPVTPPAKARLHSPWSRCTTGSETRDNLSQKRMRHSHPLAFEKSSVESSAITASHFASELEFTLYVATFTMLRCKS